MNTQQQIAEYNRIRQDYRAGEITDWQLWWMTSNRLDEQHEIRLYLELGFIPHLPEAASREF